MRSKNDRDIKSIVLLVFIYLFHVSMDIILIWVLFSLFVFLGPMLG